jgi:hypothetical protein
MNENHMKTSVTTGEVSLRWAKKADQRAKSSENGPISPNCYLLGIRRRLDYGPRRQKYHENAGNNHLKAVNIKSNGKSRIRWRFYFTVGVLYSGLFLWVQSLIPGMWIHTLRDMVFVLAG